MLDVFKWEKVELFHVDLSFSIYNHFGLSSGKREGMISITD